jgi:transcriptional regulator with XRE-family HTH domain
MTQAEFAERIGISQNYLSTMERGQLGMTLIRFDAAPSPIYR